MTLTGTKTTQISAVLLQTRTFCLGLRYSQFIHLSPSPYISFIFVEILFSVGSYSQSDSDPRHRQPHRISKLLKRNLVAMLETLRTKTVFKTKAGFDRIFKSIKRRVFQILNWFLRKVFSACPRRELEFTCTHCSSVSRLDGFLFNIVLAEVLKAKYINSVE